MTADELKQRLLANGISVSLLDFVSEADVAEALGVVRRTLQRHRLDGLGPKATQVGKRWMYSLDNIVAFINATSSDKQ
jgi:predicted site-specific integrase-resolvase